MTQAVFRFAPSPNGRLHLGHAYSALLNQRLARAILPWLIPPFVVLILVCAFPILSTGLPSLMD